jgi:hypothetical protein
VIHANEKVLASQDEELITLAETAMGEAEIEISLTLGERDDKFGLSPLFAGMISGG